MVVANRLVVLGLLLSVGCGSDPITDPPEPDPPDPDPPVEQFGESLFLPDTLNSVDITIDAADWDALRIQTRSFIGALAGDCQAQPFEKPYTYFGATITVNGVTVENVGVRKKGFIGSLSEARPSLKIRLDEFVDGQDLEGLDRLTLNNMRQDPTVINTCLGYGVFRSAGFVAPRCNFAHVTVNGVSLGVYAHVDSLRKKFVRLNYENDEGNLWEGTLSDFRDEWTGTFELKTNRTTTPTDVEDLTAAAKAPDEELIASLSNFVDIDRYYRFWATETVVGHWDGMSGNANNFYFYRDPDSGLFDFIPWGADALFRRRFTPYDSVQAASLIPRRLYRTAAGQAGYFAAITDVLDEVWDEAALVAEADRMAAIVRPFIPAESLDTFEEELERTRDYIREKRALIEEELAQEPPELPAGLREDFCFDTAGQVSLSLDSLWNAGTGNLGTGTLSFDLPGVSSNVVAVRSLVGEGNGVANLFVSADLDDGSEVLFSMTMPLGEVKPGGSAEIDWVAATGQMHHTPPGGTSTLVSRLALGQISVSQGSTADNAAVELSLTADLHELGL